MQISHLPLRKFVAPEFIIGEHALSKCADYVAVFGAKKALLVTDPGLVQAGWVSKVEQHLKEQHIHFERFDAVSPNPRDTEVKDGALLYRRMGCDMIIAIGGGSPIDCAKGIGIVVSNGGSILDYEGVDKIERPIPPLLCIPTTAGTGADISQFAIILDNARKVKIAIISKGIVPDISLIDPLCTATMDPELTAATGMDALTHAFEAYVSNASSPVTDMHALQAIEYLSEYLPGAYQHPLDISYRSGVMLGSLFAGLAFSNESLGIVHAMAHALGGLLDLPHGLCNALILEHSVAYNFSSCPERYRTIAEKILKKSLASESDETVRNLLQSYLETLRRKLNLGNKIEIAAVDEQTLVQLARVALRDPCVVTNPRTPKEEEIQALYAKIL
ncbi:MAG: iron-containing alcohol dehydrogenase [Treponema sp.]|nr:iron-containing alcohol dehydrogenase [Treponema sp.]